MATKKQIPKTPKQPAQQTPTLTIIAFIVSILALFFGLIPLFGWLLIIGGLILSIIALQRHNKEKQPGKGLATAGIIISSVALIVLVLAAVALVAFANIAGKTIPSLQLLVDQRSDGTYAEATQTIEANWIAQEKILIDQEQTKNGHDIVQTTKPLRVTTATTKGNDTLLNMTLHTQYLAAKPLLLITIKEGAEPICAQAEPFPILKTDYLSSTQGIQKQLRLENCPLDENKDYRLYISMYDAEHHELGNLEQPVWFAEN